MISARTLESSPLVLRPWLHEALRAPGDPSATLLNRHKFTLLPCRQHFGQQIIQFAVTQSSKIVLYCTKWRTWEFIVFQIEKSLWTYNSLGWRAGRISCFRCGNSRLLTWRVSNVSTAGIKQTESFKGTAWIQGANDWLTCLTPTWCRPSWQSSWKEWSYQPRTIRFTVIVPRNVAIDNVCE